MSSICLDQQKFHLSHQLLSPKRTIDIPPRKLFTRGTTTSAADMFSGEDMHMHKFLPYNGVDNDDSDQFSSDHFRMYEFKVRRCTRSRSHDWTDCPFAHPGEKARRRDPTKYHYSGVMCADYRRGACSHGDNCEFAHGVFECWLHPSRYRTEACKDGKHCKRKVCFFAHSARELRVLPVQRSDASPVADGRKYGKFGGTKCCMFSPTSTLVGLSHLSPPISPSQSISPPFSPIEDHPGNGFSRISRFGSKCAGCESSKMSKVNCYRDMLTELMTDLEAMNLGENSPLSLTKNKRNVPWINLPLTEDDTQFILSPSTPNHRGCSSLFKGDLPTSTGGSGNFFNANCADNYKPSMMDNCPSPADPDFGWVNELLM